MKKIFNLIILACTISFCVSCSAEKFLVKNTDFTRVDSIKTEFLDVNYLSKVDFILLDSNKNAFFSKVSKILEIGDMFCFVCKKENKIVFFDSLGNYVKEVKRVGRGHGEYTYLDDVAYDEYNEQLLLLVYPNSIMRLDKKGNYIGCEQLDEYYNEINVDKEYIYLTNSTYVNNKLSDYSLTVINKKTGEKKSLLPLDVEFAPYCSSGINMLKSNGEIIFTRKFDNHIYKLKNGEVSGTLEVDMASLTFPQEKKDRQYDCVEITQLCAKNKYVYVFNNVVETKNYILYSSNLGDMNICNKKNMQTIHYNKATLTSMAGISNMLYIPFEGNKYDFCFVKDNASVSAMIESNEKYKLSPSVDKKFLEVLSKASNNSSIVVLCKFK